MHRDTYPDSVAQVTLQRRYSYVKIELLMLLSRGLETLLTRTGLLEDVGAEKPRIPGGRSMRYVNV